jgi:two-component system chemotaxis response regulator CheY
MNGTRILVVDDDESIRQVVKLFLEDEGFEVRTAANGLAALASVADYPPDIILLDLRMPVMSGFEFAERYRAGPCPHAPIVVFVATVHAEHDRRSIAAASVLEKPFDLDDLLRAVSAARCASGEHVDRSAHLAPVPAELGFVVGDAQAPV